MARRDRSLRPSVQRLNEVLWVTNPKVRLRRVSGDPDGGSPSLRGQSAYALPHSGSATSRFGTARSEVAEGWQPPATIEPLVGALVPWSQAPDQRFRVGLSLRNGCFSRLFGLQSGSNVIGRSSTRCANSASRRRAGIGSGRAQSILRTPMRCSQLVLVLGETPGRKFTSACASGEPHGGVGVMLRMIVSSDRFRTRTSSCESPRSRRSSNS